MSHGSVIYDFKIGGKTWYLHKKKEIKSSQKTILFYFKHNKKIFHINHHLNGWSQYIFTTDKDYLFIVW